MVFNGSKSDPLVSDPTDSTDPTDLRITKDLDNHKDGSCGIDYIEENGTCKRRPGDRCITGSECPSNYFCFNGLCTRRPLSWEECIKTTCNEGLVCLDYHLLKLTDHDRFGVMPGWWALRDCRDICDSEVEGFVYVIADDSIFWMPTRTLADRPKRIAAAVISTNERITRIFLYRNYFTCLSDRGKLYRGFNLRHGHVNPWNWEEIEFLAGRDLTEDTIRSVSVSNDGLLDIKINNLNNQRLIYLNRWLEETSVARSRVSYSSYRVTTLYLRPDDNNSYSADLYLYDDILLFTINNVMDACIDPTNPTNIIVIKETGIRRCSLYCSETNNYFTPENSKELKNYHIVEDALVGKGNSLFVTSEDVWLLSTKECIRI